VTGDHTLDLFDDDSEPETESPHMGPPRRGPRVWSVTQVNQAVRLLLEDRIPPVWVVGEVAGWTRARSGHCYFTLKDEVSQLKCVLFRADADRVPTDPAEGTRVRAYGALTLYEARGDYQMVARRLETEEGEGTWKKAFEELRRKLELEGLTSPDRKRALPDLPTTVGVVTSITGAALRDMVAGFRSRAPWVRVLVRNARVQGEGSSESVAAALRTLSGSGLVDVVIVGRGGGSIEDLWAFNEEPVARAIAESAVPVVSAVGHEVDVTIADLVADVRAPTPTAAATLVVQAAGRRLDALAALRPRYRRALQSRIERMVMRRDDTGRRAERAMAAALLGGRARATLLAGRLNALSPLKTLERGYAVALDPAGRVVRSRKALPAGASFLLKFADGKIAAESRGARNDDR